jgi:hypothetical protein
LGGRVAISPRKGKSNGRAASSVTGFALEKAGKVVASTSHTLDAKNAQPCNDFALLSANHYSDSTKVVASLRASVTG